MVSIVRVCLYDNFSLHSYGTLVKRPDVSIIELLYSLS